MSAVDGALDARIDAIAIGLARRIIAKPERDTRESSAWIYRVGAGAPTGSRILDGERFNVGNFTIQQYGVPDHAILVAFLHSHPCRNEDDQPLIRAGRPDNFDLNAIARSENYAQARHRINVEIRQYRGYILMPKSIARAYAGGGVLNKYLRATHRGPYDVSSGLTITYTDVVPDASFAIGG